MKNIKGKLSGAKKSKTVVFNTIMAAALPAVLYAQEMLPILKELMTPTTYQVVGLFVVITNIVLRFKTEKSLGAKQDE